jgi:hypothetical protein
MPLVVQKANSNRKSVPTPKVLITLLFWEGDKKQTMKLARLLADLEPKHCDKADFLFVARFDCKHDEDTIKYVARKFNVYRMTSKSRAIGWPLGCNGIFFSAIEWAYFKMLGGQIPHYRSLLILAGDGGPIVSNWLDLSVKCAELDKTFISGALIPGEHEHINGDFCFVSCNLKFLKWLIELTRTSGRRAGWDWYLAPSFRGWGWKGIPAKSVWRKPEPFSESDWENEVSEGTIWYHGVKDDSLIDMARKKLLR